MVRGEGVSSLVRLTGGCGPEEIWEGVADREVSSLAVEKLDSSRLPIVGQRGRSLMVYD